MEVGECYKLISEFIDVEKKTLTIPEEFYARLRLQRAINAMESDNKLKIKIAEQIENTLVGGF